MQDRKELHDRIHTALFFRLVVRVQTAHLQVLFNSEVREHAPALRDKGDALLHYLVSGRRKQLSSRSAVSAAVACSQYICIFLLLKGGPIMSSLPNRIMKHASESPEG